MQFQKTVLMTKHRAFHRVNFFYFLTHLFNFHRISKVDSFSGSGNVLNYQKNLDKLRLLVLAMQLLISRLVISETDIA